MREQKGNLYIHVESVDNGYILKDLTKNKENKDEKPKTYIAGDVNELKIQMSTLVEEHLPSFIPVVDAPEEEINTFEDDGEKRYQESPF